MHQNSLSGGIGKGTLLRRIVSSGLLPTLGMYRVLGDKGKKEALAHTQSGFWTKEASELVINCYKRTYAFMFNIFSFMFIYINWSLGNNCLFLIYWYV